MLELLIYLLMICGGPKDSTRESSVGIFIHAANTVAVDENGEAQIRGAINGGLFKRGTHGLNETFLEVTVPSIDEYLKKVEAEGGQLVKPKGPILDIAYFAVVRDTEGNAIGLWEEMKK
jgi:predicted enzyme related to lactoylglutathione lyase